MPEAVAYLPLPSFGESLLLFAAVLAVGLVLGYVLGRLRAWHGDIVRLCMHHYHHGRAYETGQQEGHHE